jgi:hypothetical protein
MRNFDASKLRYEKGEYCSDSGDDFWKAKQVARVVRMIPELRTLQTCADVGCGNGGVLACLRKQLGESGVCLVRTVGYDIAPIPQAIREEYPELELKQMDFLEDDQEYDLVTLNDVIEHVVCPQDFLKKVGERARYVALHIPLDDRVSVLLANQFNYRIGPVGHISLWSPASAINLLTSAGLLPLYCRFSPGFLAPSGRKRLVQKLALPLRFVLWNVNRGLTARTIGGVSLAVLCRGNLS